jgi:Flp pilus assembly protein TadD
LHELLDRAVELHQLGALSEAEKLYREALESVPDEPEIMQRLGTVLATRWADDEEGEEAVALLQRAAERSLPITKATAGVHSNLGNALRRAERYDEAETVLRSITDAIPKQWEAWHNLGHVYKFQLRYDEAAAALRRALALAPEFAPNHAVLGEVLIKLGRLNAATSAMRRAVDLGYEEHDVLTMLGVAHRQLGELIEAERLFRDALALVPESSGAESNLAIVLAQTGRFEEARTHHDRAIDLDPDNVNLYANRAYARLTAGDIPDAWDDWERAIQHGPRGFERNIDARRWEGEDISGDTLMVYREQGIGDEVLFASCYAELLGVAGKVIIETEPRVTSLIARSVPGAIVRAQTMDSRAQELLAEPDFDVVVPSGSVPRFLRRSIDDFPDRRAYLVADPERVATWRERLATMPSPRIGISWRSKLNTAERRLEYTRLSEWHDIFAVPGVSFFNLQYDDCERDLADAERRFGVTINRWASVDYMNDFEEVAALMANLDLVLAPRNAVAMLAGSLGVPTVMMGNRWDWSDIGTDACPWLPSVTLVYREIGQEWDDVLATAARRVEELALASTTH